LLNFPTTLEELSIITTHTYTVNIFFIIYT